MKRSLTVLVSAFTGRVNGFVGHAPCGEGGITSQLQVFATFGCDSTGTARAMPFGGANPFAVAPTSGAGVGADAPEGSYEYQVIKSGPDVPAE